MISSPRREIIDTGLQWLGAVPDDWRLVPLWTLFGRVKRTGFNGEQLLSVYREHGVIPKASRDDNFNKPSDDLSLYQLVNEGDLAINKMKAWQGSVAISEHRGIVSPAYFVFAPRHSENPRFLHYLFRSPEFTAGYLSISKGIRPNQWDLEPQEHSRMLVPLPSTSEQSAIANLLDRETVKIDTLVQEQRRLIELLKEKRQAVISYAVTKGLDVTAKMKPSGVECLGDVPEHWGVLSCRHLLTRIEQGWSPECENRQADIGEWGVLRAGCANDAVFRETENKALPDTLSPRPELEVQVGDVIMSRANGSPDNVGATAYVSSVRSKLMLSDKTFRLHPSPRIRPKFLALLLGSRPLRFQIERSISGADGLANNLPQSALRAFVGAVPPLAEQDAIIERVQLVTERLGALASDAERAIGLLIERRAALVSAAVTGRIGVPHRANSVRPAIDTARLRILVAAEIVDQLSHKKTFGRVKLQKLLYLAEADAGIEELQGQYLREAAGPLDRTLIAEVDAGLQRDQHVTVVQSDGTGSQVVYHLRGDRGAYHDELVASIGDRAVTLRALVAKLGDLDTKSVEAVTTLYAAWNDALLDHREPTDAMIVSGVLEDWHPEKARKFKAEELHTWLGWMRRNKLVPHGNGPRTITGRLFV